MTDRVKQLFPGVMGVYLLAVLSGWLNSLLTSLVNLEALTIGIILGMLIGNLVRVPGALKPGVTFSLETILKAGVILLGLKLDFHSLIGLGWRALLLVLILVPSVLILACLLGRLLRADARLSTLIGVGSCICGASAVVAVAPSIGARKEDSVVAVSVVSFLGAIGVLVYTVVAMTGSLTDVQYGIWSGTTLQAVAHALAAAFARGPQAGEIGTLTKMARVVMLVPVALVLGLLFGRGDSSVKNALKFPSYVLWFIIAGALRSANLIPSSILGPAARLSSTLILMAMIAMGLSVDFQSIRDKGFKGLTLGALVFLGTSMGVYALVTRLF